MDFGSSFCPFDLVVSSDSIRKCPPAIFRVKSQCISKPIEHFIQHNNDTKHEVDGAID